MKVWRIPIAIALAAIFWGCNLDDGGETGLLIFTGDYDFNEEQYDWAAGFADYPSSAEDSSKFELKSAYTEPIDSKLTKRSVMLSGKNVNRDLFMYIKKEVSGLKPNTDYTLTFSVELASDLNAATTVSGGSVYLKAGATGSEPKSVIDAGRYVMNIDKGNQESAGEDMVLLGDILAENYNAGYAMVTRTNTMSNSRYTARSNSDGALWLIVGTDSSLEGTTKVFYTRIKVVFSAS